MTVKELKETLQKLPDEFNETLVVMEGRWEEIFEVNKAELADVGLTRYPTKVLYLS